MNNNTILQIRSEALKYAARHGFGHQECEDFAQEASYSVWENPSRHIEFLFVDYLRREFGRVYDGKHNESGQMKTKTRLSYGDLDVAQQTDEDAFMTNSKFDLDFSTYQDLLDTQERTIITLLYKWDFTLSEVGECLGVSESRVSQRLVDIKRKLPLKLERLSYSKHLTPEICS